MGMIIRFEPSFAYLETLPIFGFGVSAQPMPLVLVQEDLKRSDAPTLLALLTKFLHVCQCGVRFDEQHTLTDGRASRHFYDFSVLPFAFTLFLLHKDEGHWLNGQPDVEDKESFQVGEKWFKPNYHAHIVFDWMNHDTGKSQKLNNDDMIVMQTLASDILSMKRGQSKVETGKKHLERNDFIIEKQKTELQHIDAVKRYKEQQVNLAEQELKQVKSEIRTDKLKSIATDAATAIASGVGSLFGSGKLKDLEQANEKLRLEVIKRDKGIDELKVKMQQIQEQHGKQIRNLQGVHNQELEAKEREISRLNALLEKAFKWFPMFKEMLRMEEMCYAIGFTKDMINSLLTKKEAIRCNGKIYSEEHKRRFEIKNDTFKVEKSSVNDNKLVLTINRQPISEWFKEQWERLQQAIRKSVQTEKKSRGFRM